MAVSIKIFNALTPLASLNNMAAWLGSRWTSEALCGVDKDAARFRDSGSIEPWRSLPAN